MYDTKNDLPVDLRAKVAELLGRRLADAIDLALQSKHAHWNVKGPSFHALHRLFDDVYEAVDEYVDLIAERIVQLGGLADGTAASVVKRSSLPPYPRDAADGMDHVRGLSTALAAFGAVARKGIEGLSDWGDAGTAELMTEISRGTDKYLWIVEAHIQRETARH
jgi:starvation-inducible DNA-binding protein